MAFVFHRRLAMPLWAIAFFTVALTSPPGDTLFVMPPTTVFAIAAVGIAAMVFLMPALIPWRRPIGGSPLPRSRSPLRARTRDAYGTGSGRSSSQERHRYCSRSAG